MYRIQGQIPSGQVPTWIRCTAATSAPTIIASSPSRYLLDKPSFSWEKILCRRATSFRSSLVSDEHHIISASNGCTCIVHTILVFKIIAYLLPQTVPTSYPSCPIRSPLWTWLLQTVQMCCINVHLLVPWLSAIARAAVEVFSHFSWTEEWPECVLHHGERMIRVGRCRL